MMGRGARWWSAACFATGSTCFLLGPLPGYGSLVGETLDAITFFVGSLLFTTGGVLQSVLAAPARRRDASGRAAWRAAAIQSAGTLFFNVTTYRALHVAVTSPSYNRLVWRPDALGSICFLVSGAIAYRASPRRGLRPLRTGPAWWIPGVNMLGCVFFGVSAVAGHVVPASGSVLDLAASNFNTSLGAACFLACAIPALRDRSSRVRRGPRQARAGRRTVR
jgi:hypothetical protein